MIKFFSSIKSQVPINSEEYNKPSYFYKRMTVIIFRLAVFLISPVFFVGSYLYITDGLVFFALFETLAGIFIIFLVYFKPVGYMAKKNIILTIFYIFSIIVLLTTGLSGGGMVSLMTTIIFINLLTPTYKKVMIYFGMNTVVLVIISIFLYTGLLDNLPIIGYIETWPFLVLLISVYTLAVLFTIQFYKRTLVEQYDLSQNHMLYLSNIINSIDDIIITVDEEGLINYYNQSALNEFFHSPDYLGKNFQKTMLKILLHNLDEQKNAYVDVIGNNENHYSFESLFQGKTIYLEPRMFPITQAGKTVGAVYVFHDETQQYLKNEELSYISFHDHLTGLYNRRFFEVELSRLNSEKNLPLALIMIDVNGLKLINDSFGHTVGDLLLIAVANSIREALGKSTICSRVGGDEFVVILPQTSKNIALSVVKKIQDVSKDKKVNGIAISFAVGIGILNKKDDNLNQVFKKMEDDLYRNKLSESNSVRSKTIDLILQTLYEKNNREMNHSKRVSHYCELFAKALKFDQEQVHKIRLAGLMHDIGKIGVDETILNKKTKLTDEEFDKIKQHSEIGFRILSSLNEFNEIAQYVYQHHERWDGLGYPNRLKGKAIHFEARLLAIADSFDAMTGLRTYRASLSKQNAIDELLRNKGKQFDPKLVDIFIEKVVNDPGLEINKIVT
ncbi:MAG: diguanylate cyclase [Tenericutes bacterium]|nr:diguanylate cyclase [Mycoplasmatota bacterium]